MSKLFQLLLCLKLIFATTSLRAEPIDPRGMRGRDDASVLIIQPPGSSTPRTLSQLFNETLYASLYGVTCDGSTDDTAALQAVIAAAQRSNREIHLPAGSCNISGTTITGPVRIAGSGLNRTILNLVAGSTTSAITISVPASAPPVNAYAHEVSLSELTIRSANRADVAGQGVAHGISLLAARDGGSLTRVFLHNVSVDGVPGDALRGNAAWKGFVESYGFKSTYVGGSGIYAVSVSDWRMFGGEIIGSKGDGVVLSGTTAMYFNGINTYVNIGINFNVFNSRYVVIDNSTIDMTGKHGLAINNTSGLPIRVSNTVLRWSGTMADSSYSDLYLAGAGDVYLVNTIFANGSISPSINKPKYNVEFGPASTGRVITSNVHFDRSAALSTLVSDTTRLLAEMPGDLTIRGAARARILTLPSVPTVMDIPVGYWTVVKRLDDLTVKICANDNSILKCVEMN